MDNLINKMVSEVMIDIETLSTKPGATILTIGALIFNRANNNNYENKFYKRIKIPIDDVSYFDVCENTKKWWKKQNSKCFYENCENPDRIFLKDALKELSKFIPEKSLIWANSPSFDCVILENAYRYYDIPIPWEFYNLRDLRTIMDIANVKHRDYSYIKEDYKTHISINDCIYQTYIIKECYKKILYKI